jgi:hypothetical protein
VVCDLERATGGWLVATLSRSVHLANEVTLEAPELDNSDSADLLSAWMKARYAIFACLIAACTTTDDRPATWSFISTGIIEPACGTAGCHSQWSQVSGVILDSREVAYKTLVTAPPDGNGPYVIAGMPDRSQLMFLLHGDEIRVMPPDAPLPAADIALIEQWIADGAKDN